MSAHHLSAAQTRSAASVEGSRLRIQVLERTGLNARRSDERIDFVLLQADHATELVCGDEAFVNELIESARRDAKALGCVGRTEPANLFGRHNSTVYFDSTSIIECS